jgi:hypothetical protein
MNMISIERQTSLFIAIGKRLNKKINVYAVGGTAMMFLGLKEATLDIDLVFENEKDKVDFKETIKSLGYENMDSVMVYGEKENRPEMLTLGDERFDLFVKDVVDFVFSENMQRRAKQLHQFGDNFMLKIADPQDILLMKCATDRLKDLDDARSIINNTKVDWNLIVKEAKNQKKLGKERAIFESGYFLEKLKNKLKIPIPKKIQDELWDMLDDKDKQKGERS